MRAFANHTLEVKMEKIFNKEENKLGLEVYIDGKIMFDLIPKEVLSNIVAELERDVSIKFEKRNKRKAKKISGKS